MAGLRLVVACCVLLGCYSAHPQAGVPCVTTADCPSVFVCTAAHVCDVMGTVEIDGAVPADVDGSQLPDGPAGAICIDAMTLQVVGVNTTCAWGCSNAGGAHCAQLVPSANALVPSDLSAMPGVLAIATQQPAMFNSDTGAISGVRAAGTGVISGIGFVVRNKVGIFTFASLSIDSGVQLTGSNAVALVATGTITIADIVDARGDCIGVGAGPGGFRGGGVGAAGFGPGGGTGGLGVHDDASGAAGGGYGHNGGDGGPSVTHLPAPAGSSYGQSTIASLIGGSGGGGGGGVSGGVGGGGGGALQIVSNSLVTIDGLGAINAGGCGGKAPPDDGGGGGGAGGTILIEAPTVHIAGKLAVNGGGGAGGELNGTDGQPGQLTTTRATGGTSAMVSGSNGGGGGARNVLFGVDGGTPVSTNKRNAGAGGGAVGRIRVTTVSGTAMIDPGALVSPAFTDALTTATIGIATTQ